MNMPDGYMYSYRDPSGVAASSDTRMFVRLPTPVTIELVPLGLCF